VKAFLYFWQENVTDKIHNQKTLLIAYNLCRTLLHCLANWGNSRNTKDAFFHSNAVSVHYWCISARFL